MMDYINWLSNVEPALHNLNKSHFVVVNNLLEHCWIWLINMLLWVFAFMFMRYFWSMHVCAKSLLQFSCSVMSDSLWPHRLQHSRLPCSSPNTKACSNSCPSSRWCHPTVSSSVIPFSSLLQSFPASGSSPTSQFFASGGPIGASASASVLPVNIQGWFPLGLTSWISLLSKGLSRVFSNTTVQKHRFLGAQLSL